MNTFQSKARGEQRASEVRAINKASSQSMNSRNGKTMSFLVLYWAQEKEGTTARGLRHCTSQHGHVRHRHYGSVYVPLPLVSPNVHHQRSLHVKYSSRFLHLLIITILFSLCFILQPFPRPYLVFHNVNSSVVSKNKQWIVFPQCH